MTPVWLVVRAQLRRNWRSWLVLAVLVGVAGGLVIAVAAGARRTDAAYPSLVAWSGSPDELVGVGPGLGAEYANVTAATIARLPQVTAAAEMTSYTALVPASVTVNAPEDLTIPGSMWHRKLLAGRLPAPGRADEADVSFRVAQAQHVAVGQTLRLTMLGARGQHVPFLLHVVGIDAAPGEFPPQPGFGVDMVWVTPAFVRKFGGQLASSPGVMVRLRHGPADVPAVESKISSMAGGKAVSDYPLGPQAANTERSIHLQAVALWLLAGLLAVLGLLIIGQLLARLAGTGSASLGTLRAVGMNPAQLTTVGLVRAGMIGSAGAVIAAAIAIATSPVFPVGLAGIAEPYPGFDADWTALLLGMLGVVAATVCCAAWPARRAASAPRHPSASAPSGSAGLAVLIRSLRPVPAATGIRLALHRGDGRTAVPVLSTVAAAAIGVIGLSSALVFTASLGNLLSTPRLFGVSWDALVANLEFNTDLAPAARIVAGDPMVSKWSGTYVAVPLEVDGVQADAITTGPGPDGTLAAVPAQGRPPLGPGDIVLGQRTLAAIGARIGDTVRVQLAGSTRQVPLLVTGTAVFPALGDAMELGTGAELSAQGLRALAPPGSSLPPYNGLEVKFRSGLSQQQDIAALTARVAKVGPFAVTGPSTPVDLVNFGQLQDLPLLLGLALGLLSLLTIAHLLVTSVRRRHRDLAVLRALGFTPRQVRATVSWMAVTVAAVALLAGVPVGMLCGQQAWRLFADQLGILPVTAIPLPALAILVAAGLALAVAVAAIPGESASRAIPAGALRAE
jgi:ABC-type lipoprotein release transport system permease subunit